MRTGHVTGLGVRGLGVLEQRPHPGPDAQRARLAEAGHELLAVVEHRVDLVLKDGLVVGIVGVLVGGADHADGPDGDDDVAVGRHLTAVDDRVHQPVVHGDHDSPPRQHADALDSRQIRDLAGPGAGGVDGDPRLDVHLLSAALVANAGPGHLIAVAVDRHGAVIREHPRPALLGAVGHRPDRLPDVDVGVGNAERAGDLGVQARLVLERLPRADLLAVDARGSRIPGRSGRRTRGRPRGS